MDMEKFPDLLHSLGMSLEVCNGQSISVFVWEEETLICLGVGRDFEDALRRVEPWFWQVMVDRLIRQLLGDI